MSRELSFIDESTGRRWKVTIDFIPQCQKCFPTENGGLPINQGGDVILGSKSYLIFDPEQKILKIKCALCGKVLRLALAQREGD